jgi:hypothetical protein
MHQRVTYQRANDPRYRMGFNVEAVGPARYAEVGKW